MYGMMHPTTVYEMHIFKDVNKSSWTSPQIHTFQLTESAASPFLSDRGQAGLKNLRRCSPAQLSFLQSHLACQNAALKSARDAEKKAQRAKELRQKKEAQKEEEKRAEEVKKWQEKIEQRALKLKEDEDNENYGRIYGGEQDDPQRFTLPNISFSPYRPTYPVQPCRSRNNIPIYSPSSFPVYPVHPPPPPPPPGYGSIPKRRQPVRENLPLQQESDWCLESVEMDLVTVVTKPKVEKPKAASLNPRQRHRNHCRDFPRFTRSRGKLPVLGYQLADSANVEFAVVYSRTVMTAVPHVVSDRRVDRAYYAESYDGGSVYEYGSDQEIDFVSDEEAEVEEGDKDKDKEEEEDLEIVEGFKNCHPITESMSNCFLGK